MSSLKMEEGKHAVFSILLLLLPLTGCGYQQQGVDDRNQMPGYQWHSLYREDIQTVAVPVFVNTSYRRGMEFSLSKAVVQDIETHTPYKVVSSDKADTILEGEITSVSLNTLTNNLYTDLPQEQSFTVRVNFTWKNLRTGQVLVERRDFDQKASFFPTLGESSFVGAQDAVERLALAIVNEMQADW
jgi:Lipopolysaccharide-assembly